MVGTACDLLDLTFPLEDIFGEACRDDPLGGFSSASRFEL